MIEANLALVGVAPPRVANISYGLYPNYRGRGWAVRAGHLMSELLHGNARTAMIQTHRDNGRSALVARRAGFDYVGVRVSPDGDRLMTFTCALHGDAYPSHQMR